MTIGRKMGFCLGGMFFASALLGGAGWWSLNVLGSKLSESAGATAKKMQLADELKENVLMFRLQERGMLLFSSIKADQQVAACRDSYDKAMAASFEKIGEIRALLRVNRGRELMDQAQAAIEYYKSHQLEVRRFLAAGQVAQAIDWDRKILVDGGAKIMAALKEFDQLQQWFNDAAAAEAEKTQRTAKTLLATGSLACLALGVVVIIAMRRASSSLLETAAELECTAHEVAAAAANVSSSSTSVAQGCTEQAASLEETSAASEQVNSMAHANTDKSRLVAELAAKAGQSLALANRSLEETVAAVNEINAQSGKISNILKVIDEIAFQTNILALNAAVEAARAGEAGMGFAVVADEVRSLAQRCAQAAKDTAELVEESIAKSRDGKEKVDQVTNAIRSSSSDAAKSKTLVDEMSQGSVEQARGIEQISKTIAQMQQVTQQTAANAEESAAAAVELNAQSESLKNIMERLTAIVGRTEALTAR